MPIDFSAAMSPKGFIHSGIKIVPRLSDLFKAHAFLLIGDGDLKNSRNLPLSLCGRERCTKKSNILINEGSYISTSVPSYFGLLESKMI